MDAEQPIDAGPFGAWLRDTLQALRSNRGTSVPCGDCVGCCTSGYSILLRPHDVALDIVPARFQSGMRTLPYPHMKMNPLDNGHCPMFVAQDCGGQCSIYAQRPQTCLDYDCRIFTAANIEAGDRPVINRRVQAWRFTYEDEAAKQAHAAIKATAAFFHQHADVFPDRWLPDNPSGLAVLALKVHELFLTGTHTADLAGMVAAIMASSRAFDSQSSSLATQ